MADTPMPLEELRALIEKATPGPWSACRAPGCKCTAVMAPNDVVAEVTVGDWGDDFPTIKLVRGDGIAPHAEAVMEQITYGHIPEEMAMANRALLAQSWSLAHEVLALREGKKRLREALENMVEMYCDMVASGDCGNWDPEKVTEVIAARTALAHTATQPEATPGKGK